MTELEKNSLQQQGHQNRRKCGPSQQQSDDAVQDQVDTGRPDGNMHQRGDEKGRRQNADPAQMVIIDLFEADSRSGCDQIQNSDVQST